MKRTTFRAVALPTAAVIALGLSLSACGASNESSGSGSGSSGSSASGASLSGTLSGAGSSAQEAAQGAWAKGFQTANSGVTVNYDPIGSGGGVEQFLAGGVKFAGSDAYLTTDQLTSSKKVCNGSEAIEVPDYISPIAVAYNLQGVDSLQLSAKTLADIMSGKITMWNDSEIKAENSGVDLPAQRISPVHRSDESGTTNNFTDYLHQATGGTWPEASETWPYKSGEGAQGTSGVVQAIGSGSGTIGYADASQLGNLSAAKIKVGSAYVAPSADAAAKVVDVSKPVSGRSSTDMAVDLARTTTEAGAYPVVLVSYLIGCPSYSDASTAKLVKGYLSYIVSTQGQQAAASAAGSAPLSSSVQSKASSIVSAIAAKS